MPNWMKNKLVISGQNIKEIMIKYFSNNEIEEQINFDFNRVIPMPKSLEIKDTELTSVKTRLALTKINPDITYYGSKEDKLNEDEFKKLIMRMYTHYSQTLLEKLMIPKDRISGLIQYEKLNSIDLKKHLLSLTKSNKFYDISEWKINNWGCKRNAINTIVNKDYSEITFDTPWIYPLEVITELARQNPDLRITLKYAEEQTAYICGEFIFENGSLIKIIDFNSYSKEAYEIYFELWGYDDSYKYNFKNRKYENTA